MNGEESGGGEHEWNGSETSSALECNAASALGITTLRARLGKGCGDSTAREEPELRLSRRGCAPASRVDFSAEPEALWTVVPSISENFHCGLQRGLRGCTLLKPRSTSRTARAARPGVAVDSAGHHRDSRRSELSTKYAPFYNCVVTPPVQCCRNPLESHRFPPGHSYDAAGALGPERARPGKSQDGIYLTPGRRHHL